ncbi:serine hydrolase domain-containing protein [Stackebrandtia nassauensis]|uniref:Beta-lactamase n=1 Tax=Stackebrandtia nassauensis (strain DSM 44728 / CIP 108903 / NRRL B-16338 / NBRC 102104 / LLR-40K-21) TaxID=446470 RepID=D3Q7J0_STANL|nr:serine hydrolase domain-containing protein [Stackebrandtia nassauensis]ADD44332.1 beta-lactamase [Stackebrandtia nassauensis DSM 44728]
MRTRTTVAGLVTGAALVAATVFTVGGAHADTVDTDPIQAAMEKLHDAGVHGVIARVDDNDQTWASAVGVADVDSGRPMSPDFEHRIGSITKTVTAVAILRQVEAGNLDLDDPVGDYLPRLLPGERGDKITVRMLLDHTSGINNHVDAMFPDLETSLDTVEKYRYRTWKPEKLARIGLKMEPTGEPGEKKSYSNTNYVIAGLVLEQVTGEDAEEHITREVIDRAGMRDTYFPGRDPSIDGPHSKAYLTIRNGEHGEFSVYNMTWAATAGALVSTADDQAAFAKALMGGRLLGDEQLAAMKDGLGLVSTELGGCEILGTNGAVPGMDSFLAFDETGERSIVIEGNTTDQRPEVADKIGKAYMGLINTAAEETLCDK